MVDVYIDCDEFYPVFFIDIDNSYGSRMFGTKAQISQEDLDDYIDIRNRFWAWSDKLNNLYKGADNGSN